MSRPDNLHGIMSAINYFHMEANPEPPDPDYIERMKRQRDRLIEKLKEQGKQVILVKADFLESCGRYVCDNEDGFNGFHLLPGSTTIEQEA